MMLISPFLKANSLLESACLLTKELIVWGLAYLFTINVFLLTTPFLIYRKLISNIAKYSDKDITTIVTGLSALFHRDFDCLHKKPLHTIVACLRIKRTRKGSPLTVANVQQAFLEKVIQKRDGNGKLVYPELQQHYIRLMGYSFLKWDRKFDISNHVTVYQEDNEVVVNRKILMEIWEELLVKSFHKEKSPWEAIFVENYVEEEGEGDADWVILVRLHHSIADGFCFEHILSSLFDSDYKPDFTFGSPSLSETAVEINSKKWKTVSEVQRLLINLRCLWMGPYDLVNKGIRYADDFHSLHFPADEKSNDYFVVESPRIPVNQLKKIKQRLGVGFTTVLVGVAAGAIRKFLERNAMPFPERYSTAIPFPSEDNKRGEKLGNDFFLAVVDLPIHLDDQQARLRHVQQSLENLRYSSFMKMMDIFIKQITNLPSPILRAVTRKSCFSGSYSTVPGPDKIVSGGFEGGCDLVEGNFTHGLGSDSLGLVISSITFGGYLRMTLVVERNLMGGSREKAEKFVDFLMEEYQELSKFALR